MLSECKLNLDRADSQLAEFKKWLSDHAYFSEKAAVGELKSKLDLCLLIHLAVGKGIPDRYKREFAIQGAFRADLVLGCSTRAHFVLVEFEGGERNSLFTRGTKQLRNWAPQLQHAFSQVSDWTWAKNDNQKSDLYRNAFCVPNMAETYLVVCGRASAMTEIEKARLHWRSTKTMIASCPIHFWTYDDLCVQAEASLDILRDIRDENARA